MCRHISGKLRPGHQWSRFVWEKDNWSYQSLERLERRCSRKMLGFGITTRTRQACHFGWATKRRLSWVPLGRLHNHKIYATSQLYLLGYLYRNENIQAFSTACIGGGNEIKAESCAQQHIHLENQHSDLQRDLQRGWVWKFLPGRMMIWNSSEVLLDSDGW